MLCHNCYKIRNNLKNYHQLPLWFQLSRTVVVFASRISYKYFRFLFYFCLEVSFWVLRERRERQVLLHHCVILYNEEGNEGQKARDSQRKRLWRLVFCLQRWWRVDSLWFWVRFFFSDFEAQSLLFKVTVLLGYWDSLHAWRLEC